MAFDWLASGMDKEPYIHEAIRERYLATGNKDFDFAQLEERVSRRVCKNSVLCHDRLQLGYTRSEMRHSQEDK